MNRSPLVEAEITFIPESQGGRSTPPSLIWANGSYRPHIVVGDPDQRQAIMIGNEIQEIYLGIVFETGPLTVKFNEPLNAEFSLLYWPQPAYEFVKPEATFTVREGARIVGFGRVKKLSLSSDA